MAHRKAQLESMSQVYEEVNVSYQREKRSREKLDEENKKFQGAIKQLEESKAQCLSWNENLKRDIQLLQENARLNEVRSPRAISILTDSVGLYLLLERINSLRSVNFSFD
jgi:predicted nuclease with TOPRIM domain